MNVVWFLWHNLSVGLISMLNPPKFKSFSGKKSVVPVCFEILFNGPFAALASFSHIRIPMCALALKLDISSHSTVQLFSNNNKNIDNHEDNFFGKQPYDTSREWNSKRKRIHCYLLLKERQIPRTYRQYTLKVRQVWCWKIAVIMIIIFIEWNALYKWNKSG